MYMCIRLYIYAYSSYDERIQRKQGAQCRKCRAITVKHFHKEHKLNKIFNRYSVKVSHSCTRNIEHIIKNHNKNITASYIDKSAQASCNCKEKNKCPLEGNCLIKNIVCMATVETETNTSSYVGVTGNSFKTRYYNHIKSLRNKRYKNATELSKYI